MKKPTTRTVLFFMSIMAAFYVILIIAIIALRPKVEATAEFNTSMPEVRNSAATVQQVSIANPVTQSATASNNSAIDANNIETIYKEAQLAAQNNDWEQAIKGLEKVQSVDETYESASVRTFLADAYFNAGKAKIADRNGGSSRIESALSLFRRGTALEPENEQIRLEVERLNSYLLGVRSIRLGSLQQAVDILQPLYETTPAYMGDLVGEELYNLYLEIGDRAMRKDRTQVAVDYYGRAQDLAVVDKRKLEARMKSLETIKQSIAIATATDAPTLPTAVPPAPPTPVPPAPAPPTPVPPTSVPPTQVPPTPTFTPPPTAAPVATVVVSRGIPASCPDKRAVITSPLEGETISGYVSIMGTAAQDEFKYYKIEIAKDSSSKFSFIVSKEIAVQNGELAVWNSELIADGKYKLRVTVVQPDGNYPTPCDVNIIVKNK